MYYYKVGELTIQSVFRLRSFSEFTCEESKADIILEETQTLPPAGRDYRSGSITHRETPEGWFFHPLANDRVGLYVDRNYACLRMLGSERSEIIHILEWYVCVAMECRLARSGYVPLHSAAIEINGESLAFVGPSGIGKSTRANAWIKSMGATLINGDRPLIHSHSLILYGVPWDGKEQCFRNVQYPLKAICEVRRSDSIYIRNMSFSQRRKMLMRQCFMPMWDTDTATMQMDNNKRIAKNAEIVRVFSGPGEADARLSYSALEQHHYLKEEPDMKAKSGFVVRNIVDEFILMPKGDNIGKFNGTILLNEVSAFVWEKLQNPISKEDLLNAILDEYEVDRDVAAKDLGNLLETLRGYDVIVDD